MRKRRSFHVEAEGPDDDALALGFAKTQRLLDDGDARGAAVAVNGLQVIENTLRRFDPRAGKSALKHGLRIGQHNLRCYSARTLPHSLPDLVLALYPSAKLLDKVDGHHEVTTLVVVPWTLKEVRPWVATWSAHELSGKGSPQPTGGSHTPDPVIAAALDDLTHTVNLSTGIAHPSDRASAVDMFLVLRDNRVPFDPQAVKAWLVRHNWSPEAANQVVALGQKVYDRRPIRGHRRQLRADVIDRWRGQMPDQ